VLLDRQMFPAQVFVVEHIACRARKCDFAGAEESRGAVGVATAPGAGLGLAISRQIIGHMNGKLELVPTRGRGACFRMTLPLSEVPAGVE